MPQEKPKKKKKQQYVSRVRNRMERAADIASDERKKKGVGYDNPFSSSNIHTLFFADNYRNTIREHISRRAKSQAHKEQERKVSYRKKP